MNLIFAEQLPSEGKYDPRHGSSDPKGMPPSELDTLTGSGTGKRQAVLSSVYKGDQIFVLKCIYQFFRPNRWDVIVFKNPLEPKINYIKRLVGKPGEKIEIIDGDIYINDRIMRKPPKVQEELWMPIYEADYIPSRPQEERFNRHAWRLPFENVEGGRWVLSGRESAVFSLDGPEAEISRIQYNPQLGNDFRAAYAYDPPEFIRSMPICSDLMISLSPNRGRGVGIELGKYGRRYQGGFIRTAVRDMPDRDGQRTGCFKKRSMEGKVLKPAA